jgi:Fe-S-cluster containining protein
MTKAIAKKHTKVTHACTKCTGLCCRYFALPLDNPEEWKDYDDIRWYLCHENTSVFVEDGQWYLNVDTKCRYLSSDNHRCEIYQMRPKICRKYDTDKCDLSGHDYGYELHFTNDKQMEEYMRIKFGGKVFDKLETPKKKSKKKSKKAKA